VMNSAVQFGTREIASSCMAAAEELLFGRGVGSLLGPWAAAGICSSAEDLQTPRSKAR
jgi:hypothetical protein